MQSTQQCFANCSATMRGEHILFRSFGLDVTDRRGRLTRADILNQVESFYPNISKVNIEYIGENEYNVELVGQEL